MGYNYKEASSGVVTPRIPIYSATDAEHIVPSAESLDLLQSTCPTFMPTDGDLDEHMAFSEERDAMGWETEMLASSPTWLSFHDPFFNQDTPQWAQECLDQQQADVSRATAYSSFQQQQTQPQTQAPFNGMEIEEPSAALLDELDIEFQKHSLEAAEMEEQLQACAQWVPSNDDLDRRMGLPTNTDLEEAELKLATSEAAADMETESIFASAMWTPSNAELDERAGIPTDEEAVAAEMRMATAEAVEEIELENIRASSGWVPSDHDLDVRESIYSTTDDVFMGPSFFSKSILDTPSSFDLGEQNSDLPAPEIDNNESPATPLSNIIGLNLPGIGERGETFPSFGAKSLPIQKVPSPIVRSIVY